MENKRLLALERDRSTRREFIVDSVKLAMLLGVPAPLRLALGSEAQESLVFVFLRGGADGLSLVRPRANGALKSSHDVLAAARPRLMIQGAVPLANSAFEIHPELRRIKELYDGSEAVFVHGAGSPNPTRSHFQQQDLIELGNPSRAAGVRGGFLNRSLAHLASKSLELPAVSLTAAPAMSLRGPQLALALPPRLAGLIAMNYAPGGIVSGLTLEQRLQYGMRSVPELEKRTAVDSLTNSRGAQAQRGLGKVREAIAREGELTLGSEDQYANLPAFRTAVQLLATDPGLRFVTIDVPGWDTHQNISVNDGTFARLVGNLDKALGRMADDLKANGLWGRTTIVVMSEFGRRVAQNGSEGLDHGRGGLMMVLGGQVAGKKVVIQTSAADPWTLQSLDGPGDVRVTVDYRHVFAELLKKRFGIGTTPIASDVFPGFEPIPLGVFKA